MATAVLTGRFHADPREHGRRIGAAGASGAGLGTTFRTGTRLREKVANDAFLDQVTDTDGVSCGADGGRL